MKRDFRLNFTIFFIVLGIGSLFWLLPVIQESTERKREIVKLLKDIEHGKMKWEDVYSSSYKKYLVGRSDPYLRVDASRLNIDNLSFQPMSNYLGVVISLEEEHSFSGNEIILIPFSKSGSPRIIEDFYKIGPY